MSLYSANSLWHIAHLPPCSTIFRFSNFRISAGDLSSRYPLGWCGSSIRCTPSRKRRSRRLCSRPQQNSERWIGHNSFLRTFMEFLLSDVQWLVRVVPDARIRLSPRWTKVANRAEGPNRAWTRQLGVTKAGPSAETLPAWLLLCTEESAPVP